MRPLLPAVRAFAGLIEERLAEHDAERGARGWLGDSRELLLENLSASATQAAVALAELPRARLGPEGSTANDRVAREFADVAAWTMFLADSIGGLIDGEVDAALEELEPHPSGPEMTAAKSPPWYSAYRQRSSSEAASGRQLGLEMLRRLVSVESMVSELAERFTSWHAEEEGRQARGSGAGFDLGPPPAEGKLVWEQPARGIDGRPLGPTERGEGDR